MSLVILKSMIKIINHGSFINKKFSLKHNDFGSLFFYGYEELGHKYLSTYKEQEDKCYEVYISVEENIENRNLILKNKIFQIDKDFTFDDEIESVLAYSRNILDENIPVSYDVIYFNDSRKQIIPVEGL